MVTKSLHSAGITDSESNKTINCFRLLSERQKGWFWATSTCLSLKKKLTQIRWNNSEASQLSFGSQLSVTFHPFLWILWIWNSDHAGSDHVDIDIQYASVSRSVYPCHSMSFHVNCQMNPYNPYILYYHC